MKKLLLILAITILFIPIVTAQSEPYTVTKSDKTQFWLIHQCEAYSSKINFVSLYNGNCYSQGIDINMQGRPDPREYKLAYLMMNFDPSVKGIKDTGKVLACKRMSLDAQYYYAIDSCPSDPFGGAGFVGSTAMGSAFKTSRPNTKEMFSCKKSTDGIPRFVISSSSSCPSGYVKFMSLGFWPTTTDVPYELDLITPATAQAEPEISPPVETPKEEKKVEIGAKTLLACYRTFNYRSGRKTRQINDYYVTTEAKCPEGTQIGPQGISIDYRESDTKLLYQCLAPFRVNKNYMVSTDPKCEGQGMVGPLAYVSTVQKPGMIPYRRCRYTENNDHYTTTKQCEAAYDEGILGYINPYVEAPKEKEICCLTERQERGEVYRAAKIAVLSECKKDEERGYKIIDKKTEEECKKEVCCEYKKELKPTTYANCWEEQGKKIEVPLDQCKTPPVQAPAEDCSAIIKENEQLQQQYDALVRERDSLREKAGQQVCCMLEKEKDGRIKREAGEQTAIKCKTAAEEGFKVQMDKLEACRKEICCETNGKRDWTRYAKCWQLQGKALDLTKEQCKPAEQAPTAIKYADILSCRRSVGVRVSGKTRSMHDYYASLNKCPEGETLGLMGRVITTPGVPGTAKLLSCAWPAKGNEQLLAVNGCDPGTNQMAELAYVYTSKKEGTVPLRRCVFGANGEHFQTTGECGAGNTQEAVWYILEPVKEQPSAPAGTPLTEAQAWHTYQCMGPLYYGKSDGVDINIGPYITTLTTCGPSNQVPNDYDLGYLLKQQRTGTGAIRYCQHIHGSQAIQTITETDIKFNTNCDYDDRTWTTYSEIKKNAGEKATYGYAFLTQQPGASQRYKCVKSGLPVKYNFRISSSPTCNAGQPGWDGYQNAGSLGWWLDQPVLPAGIQ